MGAIGLVEIALLAGLALALGMAYKLFVQPHPKKELEMDDDDSEVGTDKLLCFTIDFQPCKQM